MKFPFSLTKSLSAYIIRNKIQKKERFPLVMMLEPLHACNLNCSGCGRIREYKDTISRMMSLDECLNAAVECGAPIVSICGGEPLIYPKIGKLVESLIQMDRHVYLCTNGYFLRKKLGEFKPSSHLLLNLHIDGREETHDRIVGQKGVFKEVLAGIEEARKRGFRITTNTTLCKQSNLNEVRKLFDELKGLGVNSFLISPAYSYQAVDDRNYFMSREDIYEQFKKASSWLRQYPLSNTPIYLDFLEGKRDLRCTAWGTPTRNPLGWRSPCYLLMDHHYSSFTELIEKTDWSAYGPGQDSRCRDCMVHSGFEPSAALGYGSRHGDLLRMAVWNFT